MKRAVLIFGVVVLAGLFGISSINAQEQAGAGGIGARPANPRDDNPRSKSIFVHTIANGESVDEGINIINNSDQEKVIDVYATDSLIASGGAFSCEQKVDDKDKVGSWVTLEKSQVKLSPNSSEVVNFTVEVPADADVGEHNGCLVVAESVEESEAGQGIGLSFRTALRLAILVPGDIVKSLEISGLEASSIGREIILSPSVVNSGNVSVDTEVSSYVKSLFNQTVSVSGGEFPVLRGDTATLNLRHDKPFWGGWYNTSATIGFDQNVDNFLGDDEMQSRANLSVDGPVIFVWPAPLAWVVYALATATIAYISWLHYRKRHARKAYHSQWLRHKVKKGEDLKYYEKETGVSWKKIAKLNKIKAPYALKEGQVVRLPPKKKNEK